MNVEARIENSVLHLAAFADIAAIWLCDPRTASPADAAGATPAADLDWELVVFGDREVAEALEAGGEFLAPGVGLVFVDLETREYKRLWDPADCWEDFASWCWTPLADREVEFHDARMSPHLVLFQGDWVEAGALTVTLRRAMQLWPPADSALEPLAAVN